MPCCRLRGVSGSLPSGVDKVDNIYLFNLMVSLDNCGNQPKTLAKLSLPDFLERLTTDDGEHWCYEPEAEPATASDGAVSDRGQRCVLIIDQFEEIVTAHPERWQDREPFFVALDEAMAKDPNLWVVLTLREDYVAVLDPFAALMAGRLRARYYMERMGFDAAVEAVREPAKCAGRAFEPGSDREPGAAEKLVKDLCQVRVPGQATTTDGKYVEPVQLQVVCYQLWERLAATSDSATWAKPISEAEVREAGDVNQALTRFYEDTLAAVRDDPNVKDVGVSESRLRQWFDQELITETGIRSTVFRNEAAGRTGSLPNVAVDALGSRFLLRTEVRSGGEWIELVHDRLVDPIRASNAAWSKEHRSAFQVQAALWDNSGKKPAFLLKDKTLAAAEEEVEAWQRDHPGQKLPPLEEEFLRECESVAADELMERSKRWTRLGRWAIFETLGWLFGFTLLLTNPSGNALTVVGFLLILVAGFFSVRVIWAALTIRRRTSPETGKKAGRRAKTPKLISG